MLKKFILGMEIGTTNVKAILFNLNGDVKSTSVIEYDTIYLDNGWVEQNSEDWWNSVKTAISEILHFCKYFEDQYIFFIRAIIWNIIGYVLFSARALY